ncbi:hypothetical protein DICVIV_07997 [Dictyocaulus viviparus]|uniref:Uncharacterized protein n=1 Tax=Dictyocaulus viviparus TaxID=29172 RepID=A0A0D8XQC8_DICVI|nr:hypothetical protein DICVIV_07997 [Dictyocaulus viviparus]
MVAERLSRSLSFAEKAELLHVQQRHTSSSSLCLADIPPLLSQTQTSKSQVQLVELAPHRFILCIDFIRYQTKTKIFSNYRNELTVYRLLVYVKNMEEKRRVKVARDTSIVMAVDTFITAVLHVWALIQCFQKCRAFYDENSSDEAPIEAMAIHTELDDPVIFTLPRLRRTSDSEIIGTFGKSQKIFTDHHSSMPPPCLPVVYVSNNKKKCLSSLRVKITKETQEHREKNPCKRYVLNKKQYDRGEDMKNGNA